MTQIYIHVTVEELFETARSHPINQMAVRVRRYADEYAKMACLAVMFPPPPLDTSHKKSILDTKIRITSEVAYAREDKAIGKIRNCGYLYYLAIARFFHNIRHDVCPG
ncbi:MAG: hypothetical protein AB9903_18020 [Vulcanimicrobiota bacterium]